MNNIKRQFQRLPLFRKTADMQRGFTLVEMMISVGIFVFMTALFTTRYSQFNQDILISNLAYDVALSIREAQNYGINVRESTESRNSPLIHDFSKGYGVFFTANNSENTFFVSFEDDGSLNFDWGLADFQTSTYNIKRGYFISNVCVDTGGICESVDGVSIVFSRPDPDAYILGNNSGIFGTKAIITVSTPQGQTRDIVVRSSGQISIGQ